MCCSVTSHPRWGCLHILTGQLNQNWLGGELLTAAAPADRIWSGRGMFSIFAGDFNRGIAVVQGVAQVQRQQAILAAICLMSIPMPSPEPVYRRYGI
ncbi:hypothetical protein DOE63_32525 (plasmid) [Salmonella enterica subsp. diarizonae serovar 59:z10:-]|nr:hypothetical protein DOE63_32525 [Salmonella enterica subsp. diarizonae serovar 59:z10:-]